MSAELPSPRPAPALRIEYKGFENVADRREYLLVLYRPEGIEEHRFSIAIAAFGARLIRLQDAPDLCYQKLLGVVAAGTPTSGGVVRIEDADLVSYRVAHTPAPPRRREPTTTPTHATPYAAPAVPRRPAFMSRPATAPKPMPAPPAASGFGEGQRVHHAVFGDGVISLSRAGRTAVSFDEHGSKTFLTSLLELQVLSEPNTWETSVRGKNRLRPGAQSG
jgi:hypothetical protein